MPKLLDLFCCEGGMARGYANAGFEVVGVDNIPQKRYPYEFIQGDALNVLRRHEFLEGFDAIHASPPCQADSITKHSHSKQHISLVADTRELLKATGLPYVMENVVGAIMPGSIIVCGSALDLVAEDEDGSPLVLKRHRQFESNIPLVGTGCKCAEYKARGFKVGGVYGGGSSDRNHAEQVRHGGYTPAKSVQEQLMGIDWMTRYGLNQAMPPAYGFWIGEQLREALN
jgi:DNA (cytosine-5)-methyltransferase 1